MTAKSLLMELKKRGAQLSLQNGEVVILAHPGDIPSELLEVARQAKAEIKAILAAEHTAKGFDSEQAYAAIGETLDALNAVYPEGALPWARGHRPDLIAKANAALREADDAFLAGDEGRLASALTRYQTVIYAVIETYRRLNDDHSDLL